ncbi:MULTISPECIES: malto-oligosyltrehalose synthase [Bradyrhizobium]|jgi:(1->4)-alpha-D-glucan 1-alpha-D-glucosylmutase|uniref:malto-oligosyltrehalose synthase n=1 Tax=Bradyrhizobium TaxID=374 RepID=UPI000485E141|nr:MULTISPECIES: malto-oligosyltrehalose synthase [Bradyrhizobium]MCS3451867.1 (1->4)-alpha-D-glucan 1-alpha-D-glucosylmutase [Bradyrhizobium elkanii]MCS3566034.1 (1->4)-alpha-D-glucan 1-alpha-D-glucosylmutase [Bradyrhizobium elkanii]MCW2153236.1 (1->4)-alpha-D-glucan 1-alpha-D-glucosylmutase [Bradyrhizobium elkanii]MCW2357022.1 (1->4)-alpha-D-glucan 1-alpha-D-glucosylmutase [Bradyrhizobium elkanii]MCW2376969.1 (1->4)-alpha-D-glucan 1-alpha-D-glucosylmutase [Bradyrhizobium elkanii]
MPPAIPIATYRLQLTADFDFDAAAGVAPYLKALGISHVYASPFMKARKGSTHGYDVVDHTKFNPELGGEAGFARLSDALKRHDLGLILDFVPNHVGVHFADNPWWLDVLEWGPVSPHAVSFDIDWDQLPYRARGGVLLPILGSSYGQALERGDIELRYDANEGSFSAWYFEHRLPIAPERYGEVLRTVVREAAAEQSAAGRAMLELAAQYRGLRHPNRVEAPALKAAIKAIEGGADIIGRGLDAYRTGEDRPTQTLALHHLLERQHYKLGHWRLASSDINYRRFFDVNTLAGLRVEDAATFEASHSLVKRLIAEDRLQGLRLDHIDGLRDPAQYFQRLRRLIRSAQGAKARPFYMVIEKILGEDEKLPRFSGVHGTTGYEWMNTISQALVDGRGLDPLNEIWRQISNQSPNLTPVLREAKQRVLETLLTSEFTVLARLLARIASGHYSTRDFSGDSLRQALELYVLHFPVYRTYLTASGPAAHDRALIRETIERARADWFAADEGIFDFLRDALTMDLLQPGRPPHGAPRVRRFALKVQQFTGPMMAKSLEDTAFYRYHRLLALNEVGGDPAASAIAPEAFHAMMQARTREWPHGMSATATHDTKRGEDARARIMALAEIPGEWTSAVARWKVLNAPHLVLDGKMRAPSATFEYMLYQALLGAWDPDDASLVARIQAYALKAAREGKQETSWLNPHQPYEAGVKAFIERILDRKTSPEFLDALGTLAQRTALIGALNSLSQITLKATMPGVPDFYQGTESWDLSLVDPDNRRPVDFAERTGMLAALETPDWDALAQDWRDGRLKFAWTRHLLRLRNEMADVFTSGDYVPLAVSGPHRDHVIAFARRHGREAAIVAVARSFAPFTQGGRSWPRPETFEGEIDAAGYALRDGATRIQLSALFANLPVAVLKAKAATASKPTSRRARSHA